MPSIRHRSRTWRALVLSVTFLALAASAAQAHVDIRAGRAAVVHDHKTTDAEIDAVPGLRAQLDRQAAAEATPAAATDDGFRWGDAAVGAGTVIGLVAVVGLTGLAAGRVSRNRRQAPGLG